MKENSASQKRVLSYLDVAAIMEMVASEEWKSIVPIATEVRAEVVTRS